MKSKKKYKEVPDLSDNGLLTQDDLSDLKSLQDEYIDAQDSIERTNVYLALKELMQSLQPAFDFEYTEDSISYSQLQEDYDRLSGNDISGKWASIYSSYIDFVQTGEVQDYDKSALQEYSTVCSDIYGDAIHIARSLVNTYNNTYYDEYDGCLETRIKPRVDKTSRLKAFLQPNPAKNKISVQFDNKITGKLYIYDMSGKMVQSKAIVDKYRLTIHLNLQEGIYLLNIKSVSGEDYTEKLVIIK